MKWLEIQFWKFAKRIIIKGYGCNCTTKDTDDLPELKENIGARCASCRAKEVVEWIDGHIELIKS